MTTLIGVKAEQGKEGIILASDLSMTKSDWSQRGDVAYRQQTKQEGQKIYVDDKKEIALCMSGIFDQPYIDFLSKILVGEVDVRKATKKRYFPEFKALNEMRWDGRVPNSEYMNGLLLATRFEKLKLYTCFPLGRVEERTWTSIGSGSDYALQYIQKQAKLIPRGLSLDDGVDLIIKSLEEASQDIYTGGLDLAVVTAEGIKEFGTDVKRAIDSAKQRVISRIKKEINNR